MPMPNIASLIENPAFPEIFPRNDAVGTYLAAQHWLAPDTAQGIARHCRSACHSVGLFVDTIARQLAQLVWGGDGAGGLGRGGEIVRMARREQAERLAQLSEMYQNWPFFRTVLDNVQMGLLKGDMAIASLYAELTDEQTRAGGL